MKAARTRPTFFHSTGAEGSTAREGGKINQSLACLGRVVALLADPATAGGHIPYRWT